MSLCWHLAWQGSFALFYCVYYATLCVGIGEWHRTPYGMHAAWRCLGVRLTAYQELVLSAGRDMEGGVCLVSSCPAWMLMCTWLVLCLPPPPAVLAYLVAAMSPNMDVANAALPVYVSTLLYYGGEWSWGPSACIWGCDNLCVLCGRLAFVVRRCLQLVHR